MVMYRVMAIPSRGMSNALKAKKRRILTFELQTNGDYTFTTYDQLDHLAPVPEEDVDEEVVDADFSQTSDQEIQPEKPSPRRWPMKISNWFRAPTWNLLSSRSTFPRPSRSRIPIWIR